MKAHQVLLLLLAGVAAVAQGARLADASKGTSTGAIDKVVTMLKDMLKNSKADWKSDKEAYGKFAEYCEDNTDKKTKSISEATKTIALLTNKIEEIQGSTGGLSIKVAQLKADMAENEQSREEAKEMREKENKAFEAEKKDLETAMGQMDEAIKILGEIGADQTSATNGDHEKFMAKYKEKAKSLVSIQSSVRQALVAASNFLSPSKQQHMQAFLQAPFTGTYTSQSAQIIGILKDMKDTFKTNLETATGTEKASKEAYEKFKKNKEDEHADMKKSYDEGQSTLGTNDGDLSTKKKQLQQSEKQKDEDEDFLGKLTKQCADKKEQYEERKKFAHAEEIALSKALAILDNDVTSEKFSANFLQLSSVRRHSVASSGRAEATQLLQQAATKQGSRRLSQVLLLLQAGNPFTVVLEQIDKMVKMADDEQKVDDEEKTWCEDTNKKNDKNLDDAKDELKTIKGDITKLKNDISDPSSGLKFQIKEAEDSLKTNLKNQADETKTRRKDNLEYQKDVRTMSDAIDILAKAGEVLKEYYDSLDNEEIGFIQEDPAPPKTFDGKYKGQNEQAKKLLGMLSDLSKETLKKQTAAHDDEKKGQYDYEDSMKSLTEGEEKYKESIVKLNKDLAQKEKELEAKYEDETNTEKEKIGIERYIEKLKPGCDFIIKKYDDRKKARAAEKKALEGAKSKLKGSPGFKNAQQKAKEEGFGKCKALCLKDEAGAKCKACLAGISVPGYCAGHPGASGC